MNVFLFAKSDGVPEQRIAEFGRQLFERDISRVFVRQLIGVEHDPCSPSFDCVRLNLAHLLAAGITELRLEVET